MSRYSYEMGSDGFDSPGSSIFGKPGFNFLPYGVHSPSADSLMSTGSREMMSGKEFSTTFCFAYTLGLLACLCKCRNAVRHLQPNLYKLFLNVS